LKGLDEEIYAVAQGPVSIGGFAVRGGQTDGTQINHLTVARIPGGASVEREVPVSFGEKESISLSLKSPDFTTVSRMQNVIDGYLGGSYAAALDGSTVTVQIPDAFKTNKIAFLAALENLAITPDSKAKVVLDERTGTIVMGENVRINNLALSHGNLSVQVSAAPQQPIISSDMVGQVITEEMVQNMTDGITTPSGAVKDSRLINLSPGVTLGELVRALNSVGVSPKDLIAIFQTIKASGALQADLEII
jgi:flagellar P-ring protein precursor FlgI